jgi:hypothetical protein
MSDFLRSQDFGPKLLMIGRIDLWLASAAFGADSLRRNGVDAEEALTVMALVIGLAC